MNSNALKKYILSRDKEIIYASDLYKTQLYDKINELSYYKVLERMKNEGTVGKICKGVYYIKKDGKYGPQIFTDRYLVNLFTNDDSGLEIGYNLYNKYNISTQVSKNIEVISSFKKASIRNLKNIKIRYADLTFTEEIKHIVSAMEIMQNFYNIEDLNIKAFKIFINQFIGSYSDKAFHNVQKNLHYKKSTIAFAREVLKYKNVKNNIDTYLSSFSKYKHPKMEEIFEAT